MGIFIVFEFLKVCVCFFAILGLFKISEFDVSGGIGIWAKWQTRFPGLGT